MTERFKPSRSESSQSNMETSNFGKKSHLKQEQIDELSDVWERYKKRRMESLESDMDTSNFGHLKHEESDKLVMDVDVDKPELEDAQQRREKVRNFATQRGFWKCRIQEKGEEIYLLVDLE